MGDFTAMDAMKAFDAFRDEQRAKFEAIEKTTNGIFGRINALSESFASMSASMEARECPCGTVKLMEMRLNGLEKTAAPASLMKRVREEVALTLAKTITVSLLGAVAFALYNGYRLFGV